ncbi:MAG TPA: hypothetical protein VJ964_00595 [Balneolaceae bacterium]|nr:hypothetical protein [Balneolaceae bacterium]
MDSKAGPLLKKGGAIYADIDTANSRVFLLVDQGLWEYDLNKRSWQFLDSLKSMPDQLSNLEFGYNADFEKLQLWSDGVGEMYNLDTTSYNISRIDHSVDHKNQFHHYPFFYRGTLYAFGGYGYWNWHNLLIFYNRGLKEWNIQNVNAKSAFPKGRTPNTGVFDSDVKKLFIYGGETSVGGHPDDQNVRRIRLQDIWEFSFDSNRWHKVLTLSNKNLQFYEPRSSIKVGKTNALSSSFYIPEEKIWFLPMVQRETSDNIFYLKPINLQTAKPLKDFKMKFERSDLFVPVNFLYDSKKQEAIIVGINNLANSEFYPIRVVTIPKVDLIKQLKPESSLASLYLIIGFGAVIFILVFAYRWKNGGSEVVSKLPTGSDINHLDWLNENEKKLLTFLFAEKRYLDTQEIEELLWADIDNYDYRRRLRNDIIKSANKKFLNHFPLEENLIVRKTDPNDHRRYLYGLNEKLVNYSS